MGIHLNPLIGRDWLVPNYRGFVLTRGQSKKRFVAGALTSRTKKVTWIAGQSRTGDLFCTLVWELASEHRDPRRIHLVMYATRKSRAFLTQFGDRFLLHFRSRNCPDCTRTGLVFLDSRAAMNSSHGRRTIEELMPHVIPFMRPYQSAGKELNTSLRHTIPASES